MEPIKRELTKTEIEIAVAQIIDRLSRVLDFQREYDGPYNSGDPEYDDLTEFEKKLRIKYEIPSDLCIWTGERGIKDPRTWWIMGKFKPWIKRWVSGHLHEDAVSLLMEDIGDGLSSDVPVAWVFLEKYEPNEMWGLNRDLFEELISIGSRSKKKHPNNHLGYKPNREWETCWTGACGYRYPEDLKSYMSKVYEDFKS